MENKPAFPETVASDITTAEEVFTPLIRTQFLSALLVVGVVPTEPIKTTLGVVTLVFEMVKLLSEPPLVLPSIVTKLAPFNRISALFTAPVILVPAAAGLMVNVLIALASKLAFIEIGNVSPAL